jgi:hypothetical protein
MVFRVARNAVAEENSTTCAVGTSAAIREVTSRMCLEVFDVSRIVYLVSQMVWD